MKKSLSILIACLMMLVLLAGCNSGEAPAADASTPADSVAADAPADEPADEPAAGDSLKIGLSMSSRDQFLSMLETACLDAAAAEGVELTTFDAQNDVQQQLDHINSFAAQGFNAIIVNLVETNITEGIISAANGIPVVFVNRMPDEQYMVEGITATVGSNEEQSGTLQGEFIAEYFADKDPKELNYVLMMGTLGLQHTTKRSEFPISTLEAAGFTLNKVFEDTADYDRTKAMEKMQQFLGTGKEFDVVIANNDEMALGCIEAMRAVGITDVPVVGIDATSNAIEAIKSGEMACSVFQNAVGQGEGAVQVAVKAARGEPFEMTNWIPFELVTAENVADYE